MGIEKRGFASMEPIRQRELASKGGKVAHERGLAHKWTPAEAKVAGRKGGLAPKVRGKRRLRVPSEVSMGVAREQIQQVEQLLKDIQRGGENE